MFTLKFNPHWKHKPGKFTLCYLMGVLPDGTLTEHAMVPGSDPWFFFEFWSDNAQNSEDCVYEFEFITDGEVYCIVDCEISNDDPSVLTYKLTPPDPTKDYSDFPSPLRYQDSDKEVPYEKKQDDNWWRLNTEDQARIKADIIEFVSKA